MGSVFFFLYVDFDIDYGAANAVNWLIFGNKHNDRNGEITELFRHATLLRTHTRTQNRIANLMHSDDV